MLRSIWLLSVATLSGAVALADTSQFTTGPIIEDFGAAAKVADERLNSSTQFKVAYDVVQPAEPGQVSRRLETAARFLNMHGAAGVPAENMKVAIVVHGGAHRDLLSKGAEGTENPNADLIAALVAAGVTIDLCGQTAAYYGVSQEDLLPGVTLSLSAMTSHALLQQDGYTLNPF
ncbi:MAG: DsrE family protein [Pseudomonadota bacterium]